MRLVIVFVFFVVIIVIVVFVVFVGAVVTLVVIVVIGSRWSSRAAGRGIDGSGSDRRRSDRGNRCGSWVVDRLSVGLLYAVAGDGTVGRNCYRRSGSSGGSGCRQGEGV
jgi:uncharacterized membrane-anchored protein